MKFAELLTVISVKCTVLDHHPRVDPFNPVCNYYTLRFAWANKVVNMQYHKDPLSGDVCFIEGTLSTSNYEHGMHDLELHGFKHLEKQLT